MTKQVPDISQWLSEAKQDAAASQCGMFLIHNGTVRETSRALVREGDTTNSEVVGMLFDYDQELVDAAIATSLERPGIEVVRVWLNRGELTIGDDIMYVLIGGDIRPRVIDALQDLVATIKTTCVKEIEHYSK